MSDLLKELLTAAEWSKRNIETHSHGTIRRFEYEYSAQLLERAIHQIEARKALNESQENTIRELEELRDQLAHDVAALRTKLHKLAQQRTTNAATDVLAERERQKAEEGYSEQRDDVYTDHELTRAASAYLYLSPFVKFPPEIWPWPANAWKPKGYRRNLVRAGALILAEIERVDRANDDAEVSYE